jgi:hypothetical protein
VSAEVGNREMMPGVTKTNVKLKDAVPVMTVDPKTYPASGAPLVNSSERGVI